jgi:hypothetical protein
LTQDDARTSGYQQKRSADSSRANGYEPTREDRGARDSPLFLRDSQEIARNNAEALWKRCTFDIQR